MENKDTIRVVYVEPYKTARVIELGTELEDMQKAVGGDIEPFYPFEEAVGIVCNDEGKINGMPANRAVYDENGEILYISKECFSNGCAATVDVSYPSIPMFLIYNPELVKGMMRPVYRYADSDEWKKEMKYDFAPHDVGQYPILNGQVYGENALHMQMPVEECGNMIIMEANVAIAEGNADFAAEHIDVLRDWCKYLIKYGDDPENQLCTDDFAGHLAHNCNLSVKAIMGMAAWGMILKMMGKEDKFTSVAKDYATSVVLLP